MYFYLFSNIIYIRMEFIDCCICFESNKDFELVSAGCCKGKVCVKCIKQLEQCPQCRKEFFWKDKDEDEDKGITMTELFEKLIDANDTIITLQHQNRMKDKIIQLSVEKLEGKDKKIEHLMKQIDVLFNKLKEHLEEDINIKDLEEIIKKYNLNII